MTSRWEMEFGRGMGEPAGFSPATAPANVCGTFSVSETQRVDDLLDLTHKVKLSSSSSSSSLAADTSLHSAAQFAAADVSNSEYGHYPRHASFADDIYIPSDEVAELEWLSKFVEDSFSDAPFQFTAEETTLLPNATNVSAAAVRGARSKRYRGIITGGESHLHTTSASSSSSDFSAPKNSCRKKQSSDEMGEARRCSHCASEKTPQWRAGPLGPKTLCNACGVRFKSGRLVPEYRPAASPTFVLTQHSNSHRKVIELRRQKEVQILPRHNNGAATGTEMVYHHYDVY